MPFVKIDCGMINSTIWYDHDARIIFLTALLMAEPREYTEPVPQVSVRNLEMTGWSAPGDWYGFVPSSAQGIISRAGGVALEAGYAALERLGSPEAESRSPRFDGRRMIRVDGGYLILNYDRFRQRDYTAAERQKRWRAKQAVENRNGDESLRNALPTRHVTQAEAEAEAEESKALSSNAARSTGQKRAATYHPGQPEYDLSELLLDRIRARNPQHKPPDLQKWGRSIELLRVRDHRSADEIRDVIEWCQADEFWQNNVLSTAKLRAQFDQLLLKSKQRQIPQRGNRRAPIVTNEFDAEER